MVRVHPVKPMSRSYHIIKEYVFERPDCNPGLRQFTWRRKTHLTIRRLNFFLISNNLQIEVKSCEHLFPLSSDHTPVKIHFLSSTECERGAGYRKFNNSLLENNNF